jgi:hypothetical protein
MKFYCAFFLALITTFAEAQSFYAIRRERSLILTAGTGTASYFGELSNPGDYLKAKPNLNVGLQVFVTHRIAVRVEANWFMLSGSDQSSDSEGRRLRNLSFRSSNFEISTIGQVDLFGNGNRYYRRPAFNLYGFAGIGLLYFNPKAEYPYNSGNWVSLEPLHTEGASYSRVTPVIPFGIGARIKATPNFNIILEGGYRKTFTDYLDDVSTKYLDNNSFTDPVAKALADRRPELTPALAPFAAGSIRGNPKTKDGYMLFSAKIEYYLPYDFRKSGKSKAYTKKRKATYRYIKKRRK